MRKLPVNDISTFQLREIPNELKKWNRVSITSVESYLTEYHSLEDYYLVSEAHPEMVSLQHLMCEQMNLKFEEKLNFFKAVLRTMMQLQGLGDDFSHGHLSPANILVH